MASYSVAEAKNKLPSLLAAVERGEAVTITRRGKPIAKLTPVVPMSAACVESVDGPVTRFLAEWNKLPPLAGDPQAVLRAMRDDETVW